MVQNGWSIPVILLVVAIGYFLGNIQSALIISKLFFHDDIRKYGSGNAGSTNMIRVYGRKFGFLTFAGDAGKAFLAFFLGRLIGKLLGLHADPALAADIGGCISILSCAFGHCYPVLYKFKGGKAAACCFALMYCFCWQAAIAATIAFILIFLATRRVSVISMSAAILFCIFTAICVALGWTKPYYLWYAIPAASLILYRHIPNIKRLIRGEEPKLHLIHGEPLNKTEEKKSKEEN